jgi:hypothetical protein
MVPKTRDAYKILANSLRIIPVYISEHRFDFFHQEDLILKQKNLGHTEWHSYMHPMLNSNNLLSRRLLRLEEGRRLGLTQVYNSRFCSLCLPGMCCPVANIWLLKKRSKCSKDSIGARTAWCF